MCTASLAKCFQPRQSILGDLSLLLIYPNSVTAEIRRIKEYSMTNNRAHIIFQCKRFCCRHRDLEKTAQLDYLDGRAGSLLNLIINVKNARVTEQLHRPGLFNRFF